MIGLRAGLVDMARDMVRFWRPAITPGLLLTAVLIAYALAGR